jgi:hypothetical protein
MDGKSSFTNCNSLVCNRNESTKAIYVELSVNSAVIPKGNVYFSISLTSLPYDILYSNAYVCIDDSTLVSDTTKNDLFVRSNGSNTGFCDSSTKACETIEYINKVAGYFSHATLTVGSDVYAAFVGGTVNRLKGSSSSNTIKIFKYFSAEAYFYDSSCVNYPVTVENISFSIQTKEYSYLFFFPLYSSQEILFSGVKFSYSGYDDENYCIFYIRERRSLRIEGCTFEGLGGYEGSRYSLILGSGGAIQIINSTFSSINGRLFCFENSSYLFAYNTTFSNVTSAREGSIGYLFSSPSIVVLDSCTFSNISTSNGGGGGSFKLDSGMGFFVNTNFSSVKTITSGRGGAIYCNLNSSTPAGLVLLNASFTGGDAYGMHGADVFVNISGSGNYLLYLNSLTNFSSTDLDCFHVHYDSLYSYEEHPTTESSVNNYTGGAEYCSVGNEDYAYKAPLKYCLDDPYVRYLNTSRLTKPLGNLCGHSSEDVCTEWVSVNKDKIEVVLLSNFALDGNPIPLNLAKLEGVSSDITWSISSNIYNHLVTVLHNPILLNLKLDITLNSDVNSIFFIGNYNTLELNGTSLTIFGPGNANYIFNGYSVSILNSTILGKSSVGIGNFVRASYLIIEASGVFLFSFFFFFF